MRFRSTWGIALFSVIISSNTAYAMSCRPLPDDVVKEYPIIFKGKAITTTELPWKDAFGPSLADKVAEDNEMIKAFLGTYTVTKFDVQKVYKGEIGKEIDVYHFNGVARYKDGLTYVIFTGKDLNRDDGIEGRIETDLCSPRIFLEEKDQGPHGSLGPDLERQLKAYILEKETKKEAAH
jgi:hypothetical protein